MEKEYACVCPYDGGDSSSHYRLPRTAKGCIIDHVHSDGADVSFSLVSLIFIMFPEKEKEKELPTRGSKLPSPCDRQTSYLPKSPTMLC
jgi:hypothetical protein